MNVAESSVWEKILKRGRGGKVIAQPGDLIISTLHTQNGNGMFAISDKEYICTSQIVAKIKEDIIDKKYLCLVLRKVLPTLKSRDLVGREPYKPAEILSLRIPKPEYLPDGLVDKIICLKKQRREIEHQINEAENKLLF